MMRRLLPTLAAFMGGFLPQLAQFNCTLPSLSTPSLGRLSGRLGGCPKGSNAAVKREANKRRNIAKRLPLRKRR